MLLEKMLGGVATKDLRCHEINVIKLQISKLPLQKLLKVREFLKTL